MKMKYALAVAGVALTGVIAASPASAATAPPKCVTVVDQPDFGEVYCYDLQGECTVTRTQTTLFGTYTTCVVERPI